MPQKFAFTTAAMAAALEDTPVSYEDLADIEREFDDVDTEIIRQQVSLSTPLYTRRALLTSQIPNFWPLVLEQAPPDIDQYIQPSDSAILLQSLLSLSVSHFEIDSPNGDPRSVSIKFEFGPNDYFEDKVVEKKFWYRRGKDGWSGLVSEPVGISWKNDRDLTGGLLDLVVKAWETEKKAENGTKSTTTTAKKELSPEQKALKKKIENTGMGGLSFFAWFGFIGRYISAEESAQANAAEKEKRKARGKGSKPSPPASPEKEINGEVQEEEDEELGMSLEIFPDGDDLAVAFTEDLWPGAIRYFTQAQEQDAMSDEEFEDDDDEELQFDSGNESEGELDSRPPAKKQRSN